MSKNNMNAQKILAKSGSYWMVNWRMVKVVENIDDALLLGYLCSMESLYGNENGVFYRTIQSVKEDTLMDGRRQRKAISHLKDWGLIECESIGMPKKRYFHINQQNLESFLFNIQN